MTKARPSDTPASSDWMLVVFFVGVIVAMVSLSEGYFVLLLGGMWVAFRLVRLVRLLRAGWRPGR